MRRFVHALCVSLALWLPAAQPAAASAQTDALLDLLGVTEMIEIMREEGIGYTDDLARDMLGGTSAAWDSNVAKIYDTRAMVLLAQGGFAKAMEGVDLAPLTEFFTSPAGKRLVQLEISTRRAMLDEDIEAAAEERATELEAARDPRFDQISALIDAGDMLEANVVSALNSNILFYEGLVDGGAFKLSEAEILTDVWSQEEVTRTDTRAWLYAFFLMAYAPLSVDEIDTFLTLWTVSVMRMHNDWAAASSWILNGAWPCAGALCSSGLFVRQCDIAAAGRKTACLIDVFDNKIGLNRAQSGSIGHKRASAHLTTGGVCTRNPVNL